MDVLHEMSFCAAGHLRVDWIHNALCYPASSLEHGADRDDFAARPSLHHAYHLAEIPRSPVLDSWVVALIPIEACFDLTSLPFFYV